MTRKNYDNYKKIQRFEKSEEIIYDNKQYPRNVTMQDKRIIDSRHSKRLPLLTRKIMILFFCTILVLLMFAKINNENRTYLTFFFTIVVMILMIIPIFNTMKKNYYMILLYIIVLGMLGCLGYGWGIFSVILTLNPLKEKKKPSGMKNSVASPSV